MKSLRDEIRLDGGWVDGFNFIVRQHDFIRGGTPKISSEHREDFTVSESERFH